MAEVLHRAGWLLRPLSMRSTDEGHRASTPLELLFDLCFVIAIGSLASSLREAIAAGHLLSGLIHYAFLFVVVWWAWMSFTWHATAFDNDDGVFRLLTLVQMAGALGMAAAIPAASHGNFIPVTIAYGIGRIALVASWVRCAVASPAARRFCLRYASGIALAFLLWLSALATSSPLRWSLWGAALAAELLTPVLATRVAPQRVFHAGHIAERYSLFTLIVLGESILAISLGLRPLITEGQLGLTAVATCASALASTFAIWWLYVDGLGPGALERNRRAAFAWGYGHAVLYASIAALGSCTALQLEPGTAHTSLWLTAIPVAAILLSMAWLQLAANLAKRSAFVLVLAASCVLLVGEVPGHQRNLGEVAVSIVLAATIATGGWSGWRHHADHALD